MVTDVPVSIFSKKLNKLLLRKDLTCGYCSRRTKTIFELPRSREIILVIPITSQIVHPKTQLEKQGGDAGVCRASLQVPLTSTKISTLKPLWNPLKSPPQVIVSCCLQSPAKSNHQSSFIQLPPPPPPALPSYCRQWCFWGKDTNIYLINQFLVCFRMRSALAAFFTI